MSERASAFDRSATSRLPLWRDIRVLQGWRRLRFQIAVVVFSYILIDNLVRACARAT